MARRRLAGRPWHEAVIYELHVGTFTAAGTFAAAVERLDYLAELGVTAIELMPVADFPGKRNWGYDGVLPFAPDASYGAPEDLKRLVQAAHERGLMVLLDVVYNHFGPEGNYLHHYAPQFFNPRHDTPWGAAINFDGAGARAVRDFFIHNALYWLEEYHFDGLRLDAVHAIADDSRPDIVDRARGRGARRPRARPPRAPRPRERPQRGALSRPRRRAAPAGGDRAVERRRPSRRPTCSLTGERDGYYADYAERPLWHLGRCLAEGFAYQGEPSRYRGGRPRGEPSAHLPPTAFVSFLQNHDQVGNRAFGERIGALAAPRPLAAATACCCSRRRSRMLFMGEEFGASAPFLFFCDFGPELAAAVTNGRRAEFGRFERFRDPAAQDAIPDPNDPATFERSQARLARDGDRGGIANGSRFAGGCSRCGASTSSRASPAIAAPGAFETAPPGRARGAAGRSATAPGSISARISSDAPQASVTPPRGTRDLRERRRQRSPVDVLPRRGRCVWSARARAMAERAARELARAPRHRARVSRHLGHAAPRDRRDAARAAGGDGRRRGGRRALPRRRCVPMRRAAGARRSRRRS